MQFTTGDLLQSEAEALVNTVNCVGVMGKGIALQFKERFPDNYRAYRKAAEAGSIRLGKVFVFERSQLWGPRFLLNFPTKKHWRSRSRLQDIDEGLVDLRSVIVDRGIRSIAIPPLGAGLGGLEWPDVKALIRARLAELDDVEIIVYEPLNQAKPATSGVQHRRPRMTPGRAALLGLMGQYQLAALDPHLTLLAVHKLMYFLQAAGQELRLRFAPGPYGPYAENLRHVLSALEGHFISGFDREAADIPFMDIHVAPEAYGQAEAFLQGDSETKANFNRVTNVIEGFESDFGLELLASVHWVAKGNPATTASQAQAALEAWSKRKAMFELDHISAALERFREQNWLESSPDAPANQSIASA